MERRGFLPSKLTPHLYREDRLSGLSVSFRELLGGTAISLIMLRSIATSLLLISSLLTASLASSIGINLGPTYLTSAYVQGDKDEFTTLSIKGSKAYRNYFVDVLETQSAGTGTTTHNNVAVRAIFYDALMIIKTAMEKKLGHSVDIGIISQPLYFNESTSTALTDAAKEVQTGVAGQITRFTNAARVAYGLNSCKGFGMNSSNCDINEGEHAVVVVDYNTDYLELAIGYVREDICSVRGYKRVKQLGEDHKASPSYLDDVQKVLQEFRGAYFATFDFWDYGAHVRGILLSGDASKSGMDEMRLSMAQAWPEQYSNRFKDSIDPIYVGAAGAARMAQIQAVKDLGSEAVPNDDEDDADGDDENEHDEL
jgi:hypothetical protein